MEFLKDRRTLLALIGGALALLAGVVIATMMVGKGRNETAPPPPASQGTISCPGAAMATAAGPAGSCWRYADGGWRKLPNDQTLNGCVQTLFAGRCERPGGATYGRWMQQTLRLVPGKVEVSGDNRSFRPLAEQASNCSIQPVG